MMTAILDAAAEALRQYDRGGWKLNPWSIISTAQKEVWRTKAAIVSAAMFDAAERDPTVIEAMACALWGDPPTTTLTEYEKSAWLHVAGSAIRALKAHVVGEME